jgi:wyosine [tRNA(Phe)-imidazoG37] synthetase (radical SAM superfamily)
MEYIKYDKIIDELQQFMSSKPNIDYITFSGSGEPTLNSRIGEVLAYIKMHYPTTKTAILTCGALLSLPELRSELLEADVILPSLDAGSQSMFEKINRPNPNLNIDTYIKGLIDFRKEYKGQIWLEVFLLKGYNDSLEELDLLKKAILEIKPNIVQLNTLDRPGTVEGLVSMTKDELQQIKDYWFLPNVEIIASVDQRTDVGAYNTDIEGTILSTIARRPCTLDDLHQVLGIHVNEINKYLGTLEVNNKIKSTTLDRGVFYELIDK